VEVKELTMEIQQLRSISRDKKENLSSLKKFNEVLREADALEAELENLEEVMGDR